MTKGELSVLNLDTDQPIYAASELWAVTTILGDRDIDVTQMLRNCDLSLDYLLDPHRRVTLGQLNDVYRFALTHVPRVELVELVGRRQHLTAFGMVGFGMLSSPTLAHALAVARRFWPLVNARFAVEADVRGGDLRLRVTPDLLIGVAASRAHLFAAIELRKLASFLHDLLGERGIPQEVGLDPATAAFIGADVSWAGSVTCDRDGPWLKLPARILHEPLLQAHAVTHAAAMAECERQMAALDRFPPLVERVRSHFAELRNGAPSLSQIAKQLAMSERTLRRRLDALGTSYTHILDDVRFAAARNLLVDHLMTTDLVAERLGYTETANFRHAFKRWAGESPQSFRRAQALHC